MMTSTAGAPTIISPPRKRAYDTSSLRSSARYDASISNVVNFAISAGCKLSGPEVEGDLVLPRRHAEQEQQREQHEREPVEERGALLPPFVVERHDDRHDDHRDDREDDLTGDERVRVGGDAGPRCREDDEHAEDGERRLRGHQHPVDVAARVPWAGADVPEPRIRLAGQERRGHAAYSTPVVAPNRPLKQLVSDRRRGWAARFDDVSS